MSVDGRARRVLRVSGTPRLYTIELRRLRTGCSSSASHRAGATRSPSARRGGGYGASARLPRHTGGRTPGWPRRAPGRVFARADTGRAESVSPKPTVTSVIETAVNSREEEERSHGDRLGRDRSEEEETDAGAATDSVDEPDAERAAAGYAPHAGAPAPDADGRGDRSSRGASGRSARKPKNTMRAATAVSRPAVGVPGGSAPRGEPGSRRRRG